ncbi:MAG: hypothetical protein L6Q71_05910, partial [Planctomycetes bacterium]|nr:hypothetical protein [Planctomycetota bacterium]
RILVSNIPGLNHIDCERVFFGVSIVRRQRGRHGIHAACHPLRFEGGERRKISQGRCWELPQVNVRGVEMLYSVHFYVPRFLNLERDDKIETIVHELFHISPDFNGDLRRLGRGRHAFHGPSLAHYRKLITPLVKEARDLLDVDDFPFVRLNHSKLERRFGRIYGSRVRNLQPRLVREDEPVEA